MVEVPALTLTWRNASVALDNLHVLVKAALPSNPRYVCTNYCSSDVIFMRRLWYCLFSQEKKDHSAGECTIGLRRLCRVAETPETFTLSRSEEHTYELQSLIRNTYAVFCLNKKN